jgi:hypothetical protein
MVVIGPSSQIPDGFFFDKRRQGGVHEPADQAANPQLHDQALGIAQTAAEPQGNSPPSPLGQTGKPAIFLIAI